MNDAPDTSTSTGVCLIEEAARHAFALLTGNTVAATRPVSIDGKVYMVRVSIHEETTEPSR